MKLSPTLVILNIAAIIISVIILVPSFNMNLFGQDLNYPGLDLSYICFEKIQDEETGEEMKSKCLPDFHFITSADFNNRNKLVFEFSNLNNPEVEIENKEEVFQANAEIIRERIEIVGLEDVEIHEFKDEEGKYYIEIMYHNNDPLLQNAFNVISTEGVVSIYEDIPEYEPSEDEAAAFDFLEGKKPSEILNLDDVKRVRHYFEPTVAQGQGGFVVRLDFGDENKEKVMQAAAPTYDTETPFPGIQLIQNGIPVGVQATYIQPQQLGYEGQSFVLFTVWGSPQSSVLTKSLAGILMTDPIDTPIQMVQDNLVEPVFDVDAVELSKLIIPLSLLVLGVASIAMYKKKGLLITLTIITQSIVMFAVSKVLGFKLDVNLILGFIGSVFVSIFLIGTLLRKGLNVKNFVDAYDNQKINFRLLGILILVIGVVFEFTNVSQIILEPYHGLLIFVFAVLFGMEVSLKTYAPVLLKKQ